jgi:NAD-dependent DNA ligase
MPARRPVDEDGTPFHSLYAGRVHDRLVAEMLGLVKGMICDGVLSDGEAVALAQWIRSHPDVAVHYPGSQLAERIQTVFADGMIDEDERTELEEIMRGLCGEDVEQSGDLNRATRLPCDRPTPSIFFDNKEFCMTGVFAYGTRARCEAEVSARGGRCAKTPTKKTDYLIIGLEASNAWVQGDHGTKIEHAVRLKSKGHGIAIIAEEDWIQALQIDAN